MTGKRQYHGKEAADMGYSPAEAAFGAFDAVHSIKS